MKMKKEFNCCLCGAWITDSFGNNPYPVVDDPDARCCDDCNATRVIPARLDLIYQSIENRKNRTFDGGNNGKD